MKDQRPQTGHGPKIGEINILEATIGQRGMGKSTYQCSRVFDLVRANKGQVYVIGHSLGARLPEKLPPELGGHVLPIEYHASVESIAKAITERPTNWHILAPPIDLEGKLVHRDSCDDLIKWSVRFTDSLKERAYLREHPLKGRLPRGIARKYDGIACPCVAMIVDEGIALKSAQSGTTTGRKAREDKDWFLEWIYSLRHQHTALFYAIQNATARNWQLLSEATRVVVFRVKHQWAINAVQAAGGTRREMRAVKRLEPHEYIALGEDAALADDDDPELDPIDEADEESLDVRSDPPDGSDAVA